MPLAKALYKVHTLAMQYTLESRRRMSRHAWPVLSMHMLRLVEPTGECDDVHELPHSADGQRDAAVCERRHVIAHPLQDNDAQESVLSKENVQQG